MLTLALPDTLEHDPQPAATFRALDQRWARARELGLSAEGPAHPRTVAESDLRDRRERLADTFAASSLMGLVPEVVGQVGPHGYTALIADHEGVIVAASRSERFDHTAAEVRLVEGASWSERHRGTNAIGTALFERQPVSVVGRAHYEEKNHGLVCYAAPIFDPLGELVAVFDVTARVEAKNPLVGGLVQMVARSLEQVLRESAFARAHPGGLSGLRRRVSEARGPAMAIDRCGLIAAQGSERVRDMVMGLGWERLGQMMRDGEPLLVAGQRLVVEPVLDPQRDRPIALWLSTAGLERPRATGPRSRPEVSPFQGIAGSDPRLDKARRQAERFAGTGLPVLLLAETGTGKELFARAIHAVSPRRSGPFVAINCGALASSLIESELFGHGPGAFTGASAKGQTGRLAAAHGGTLFLDEVAELSPEAQASLLRFLEDGSYSRVGEPHERKADVRLVCATCRDLPAMVERGAFRRDLYYRIRGAVLTLPRLSERSDIAELARSLVDKLVRDKGLPFAPLSASAVKCLESHSWPGNVRELKMVLEVALVLAEGEPITVEHLGPDLTLPESAASDPATPLREHAEKGALKSALERAGGNLTRAASLLGVARTTLYRMLQRHGLER